MTYSEIVSNCMNDPNFFVALILWSSFFIGSFFYFGVAWAKWILSLWAELLEAVRQRLHRRKNPRP